MSINVSTAKKNRLTLLVLAAIVATLVSTCARTNRTIAANSAPGTGFVILHNFAGKSDNGRVPYSLLVPYNGTLYGTTTYGGPPYDAAPSNPANKGNLFRMNMDGSGFTVLHEFVGGASDGWKPWSGLAIIGDTIYGSTVYGGPFGEKGGVLYELQIDGSDFRILHAFGGPGDGTGGSTSPTLIGPSLFGMTRWGGNGTGTIYRYDIALEEYKLLHNFSANGSDGSSPLGTITAGNDGFLYGLTWLGGLHNMGTLFRIKPDGSSFETLHHFAGGTNGKYPYDSLLFDGSHILYGTTLGEYGNNPSDLGTIFKYDFNNKTYSVLHRFAGGSNDSGKPNGSLTLSKDGAVLYGTTHGDHIWGGKEFGILYQMNIDGTGFKNLHEFAGSMAGDTPMRTPLLVDGLLYGMTAYGGSANYGIVYSYQIPKGGAVPGTATFKSVGTYDGWILESGENTNKGGSLNKSATTLYVGDDAKDKQYRAILSFNTASIADNATVTSGQLKIRKQGVVGIDPFTTHGNLLFDIRKGSYSTNVSLETVDFSGAASSVTSQERFSAAASGWYSVELGATSVGLLNKAGITQFRLQFSRDDNDDLGADHMKFFSGNSTADNQPQLIVTYTIP